MTFRKRSKSILILSRSLETMATRGKYKLIGNEWLGIIKELTREKVSTLLRTIFDSDFSAWLGTLHIPEHSATQSDHSFFESVQRRFRELQRTPFESLSPRLVQQITNMLLDVMLRSELRNQHCAT